MEWGLFIVVHGLALPPRLHVGEKFRQIIVRHVAKIRLPKQHLFWHQRGAHLEVFDRVFQPYDSDDLVFVLQEIGGERLDESLTKFVFLRREGVRPWEACSFSEILS
jgi:hypothetical protein